MLVSMLDDVPGLGDTRRKALMKRFGSLKRLRAASVDELMAVPGIGRRTAEAVLAAVAQPAEAEAAGSEPEAEEAARSEPAPAQADDAAAEETMETTTAPAGPAERGTPRSGSGATAEVGLVAS